jgi:predicted CXXCH cytochrome family protein
LLLAGIVWAAWPALRTIGTVRTTTTDRSLPARDVYADSPYRNARPGVAYVGDAACARCHREISQAYRAHPMGRSLAPVGAAAEGPPAGAAAGLEFEAHGVQYTVERRDGRLFHQARRRASDGSVFAEVEAEVRFALGSGTRGIAYLIEREGFLMQSPIAWFAQQQRWDVSPGYGEFSTRPDFERPIQPDCLFCHTNRVRPVAGTLNRYEVPIFEGHAIGCERCHGPGALHVRRGGLSSESDSTIVNPGNLAPALRDSVCQQCHLQGSFRVTRAGRDSFDFRPGLPMHRFWAVFLMKKENRNQFEAVGHVEQMESSRCFRASQGQLGCISCHDPHRVPAPAAKAAYYRGRCLECHEQRGCALPLAQRTARGPGEDCVACHMPRPAITNIPHTAATDHRIPRGGAGSVPEDLRVAPGQPADIPLMDYHWGLMTQEQRHDAERDLGVALILGGRSMRARPLAHLAATQALPRLEAAVRDRPDDWTARESLGLSLGMLGRPEEALRAFEEVLRNEPGRESTLRATAWVLARLQRIDRARAALQQTIAVDPWRSGHRLALAQVCAQAGDWAGAVAACREAIRLNPELVEARSLLVQCYLRSREPEKAEAEFRTILGFFPAGSEVWQQWYERAKQAGRGAGDLPTPGEP